MSANESRRRAELSPTMVDANTSAMGKFVYDKLDPNVDCTRFVRIDPAKTEYEPIRCSLVQIPFGKRPRFEAISYMWGEENPKEAIHVDGRVFEVCRNLFDALRYLRCHLANGDLFWIDALCINQEDTEERNRQLRMMGQIYFRAKGVVVWLGSKYLKYQEDVSTPLAAQLLPSQIGESEPQRQNNAKGIETEQSLFKELVADEYWNRLWIIQEVGQNEEKRVCFGNMAMTWEDFIQVVTKHSSNDNKGPLILDRQLKEKYSGSHTLRRLLMEHKYAQCKDRKDKVYGLIGLAVDGHGFPMDYEKSPMQIWTDTMEFMNCFSLFDAKNESDIVSFGSLIKFLLMDPNSSPLQQVLRSYEARADPQLITEEQSCESTSAKVFHVKAYILGTIHKIGPSTREVVATISEAEQWAEKIQTSFRGDIGTAYAESNRLMKAILASDDDTLAGLCLNHVSLVKWRVYPFNSYHYDRIWDQLLAQGDWLLKSQTAGGGEAGHFDRPLTTGKGDAYLYQLVIPGRTMPWKLGLVSGNALPGDLICWVRNIERAIVVRMYKGSRNYSGHMLQVCGSAVVGEDVERLQAGHSRQWDPVYHSERCDSIQDRWTTLKLDPRTIFVLLS